MKRTHDGEDKSINREAAAVVEKVLAGLGSTTEKTKSTTGAEEGGRVKGRIGVRVQRAKGRTLLKDILSFEQ